MNFNQPIYFISGIDTDAGKSYATAMLATMAGSSVITQKFIQTGQDPIEISEDILTHRRLQGIPLFPEDIDRTTCPIIFKLPSSPHLAAQKEGQTIDINIITAATQKLASRYKTVLIEGAGGLAVPITENYITSDYIIEHQLPLILVTTAKLGSLNHTILSLEYCKSKGISLAAVVYNKAIATNAFITSDSEIMIKKYLAKNFSKADFISMEKF